MRIAICVVICVAAAAHAANHYQQEKSFCRKSGVLRDSLCDLHGHKSAPCKSISTHYDAQCALINTGDDKTKKRTGVGESSQLFGGKENAQVCADGEGKTCTCSGTVIFGRKFASGNSGTLATINQMKAAGHKEKQVSDSVTCSSAAMGGEPLGGVYKYCMCQPGEWWQHHGGFKFCNTFDWAIEKCDQLKNGGMTYKQSTHHYGQTSDRSEGKTGFKGRWSLIQYGVIAIREEGHKGFGYAATTSYVCGCKETIVTMDHHGCSKKTYASHDLVGEHWCPAKDPSGKWPGKSPTMSKIVGCLHGKAGEKWRSNCASTPPQMAYLS